MKLTFYLLKRIAVYFLIFLIPSALIIASFKCYSTGINIFNVGIRSITNIILNNLLSIILISYTVSVIFSIALIDKVRVNSLVLLHLIPIVITAGIIGVFYLAESKGRFFITPEEKIAVGYRTFFKRDVFNEINGNLIFIGSIKTSNKKQNIFLYKTENDKIIPVNKIKFKNGSIILYGSKKPIKTFNYFEASKKPFIYSNKMVINYIRTLTGVMKKFKGTYNRLSGINRYYYLLALIVSFFIMSIPLAFILNDGAWNTSGIIGVMLIIGLTPYFYRFIINYIGKIRLNFLISSGYNYLLLPILIIVIGIILNITIKLSKKAEI